MSGNLESIVELNHAHAAILAALYARGIGRPFETQRRFWPHVLQRLRQKATLIADCADSLAEGGFEQEATLCRDSELLERALDLVEARRILTAVGNEYPVRWIERLGAAAPPALWWNGMPFSPNPSLSFVGSRAPGNQILKRMESLGVWANRRGFLAVSGGAIGCDSAAIRGALHGCEGQFEGDPSPALEILPYGIRHAGRRSCAVLSAVEPEAGFTTAGAMERNALIYCASAVTIVGHARLREGGTWIGATEALRRRHGRLALLVPKEASSFQPVHRALLAIGAEPFSSIAELSELIASEGTNDQGCLTYDLIEDRGAMNTIHERAGMYSATA